MTEHDHTHDHEHDHEHEGHDHGPTLGSVAWLDLSVEDAAPVRDFYAAVVGWTPEPNAMDGYEDWTMAGADGPSQFREDRVDQPKSKGK